MPTSLNSASREPVPGGAAPGGSGASGSAPDGAEPGVPVPGVPVPEVPVPGGTGPGGSGAFGSVPGGAGASGPGVGGCFGAAPGAGGGPGAAAGVPGALVGVGWLAERLGAPGLVLLDASVGAHRGADHRIAGARPFDLDGALSDHDAPAPHTMPGPAQFTEALRALGVHDTDTVVVYDGAGVYSSARAWWMLRAMGFDRAAVLDGGLPAWTAAGLPVEATGPAYEGPRGSFTARPRAGLLVGSATVAAALADPAAAVLDARTRERFAGTAPEPRPGLRGGHMPGAVSLPFGELQRPGGLMRPAAELREAFAAVAGDRQRLYFSCGSGVTACVLALGADLAGYRELAVYDGSWSEWGMPSELPVATGPATGSATASAGPAGPATGG